LIGKPLSSVRRGSSPGAAIIRLAVTRWRVIASLLLPFFGPKALPVSCGLANGSKPALVQSSSIASNTRWISGVVNRSLWSSFARR